MTEKINSHKAFGRPTIAFCGLQLYYDRIQHRGNAIFKRDDKWFTAHPRLNRYIRPALAEEFDCHTEHLDYFGERIKPPRLWVLVERMYGGQHLRVLPVYRGECYWKVDSLDSMVPDDSVQEDDNNTTCDHLLFQFHNANGAHPVEMLMHAEKIAEVILAKASANEGIN